MFSSSWASRSASLLVSVFWFSRIVSCVMVRSFSLAILTTLTELVLTKHSRLKSFKRSSRNFLSFQPYIIILTLELRTRSKCEKSDITEHLKNTKKFFLMNVSCTYQSGQLLVISPNNTRWNTSYRLMIILKMLQKANTRTMAAKSCRQLRKFILSIWISIISS